MPYISNNLAEELSLTDPIDKKSASNLDPFWDGIHQFPDPQIFLLENGGRVVVTHLRQSNCLLNGLEMILDCEKIMTGLLVRSSSQVGSTLTSDPEKITWLTVLKSLEMLKNY